MIEAGTGPDARDSIDKLIGSRGVVILHLEFCAGLDGFPIQIKDAPFLFIRPIISPDWIWIEIDPID